MTPIKVLVISNFNRDACGIANYGRILVSELKKEISLTVDQFTPPDPGKWPIPEDWASYDIVHINWHPATINVYSGEMFWPKGTKPLLSVFLQDLPPWSACPFFDRADIRFAAEPYPGTVLLRYPIVEYIPFNKPQLDPPLGGYSSIRMDGVPELRAEIIQQGWEINEPGDWSMSWEVEIERLARSAFNVCWYSAVRGKASAPTTCLASRRPLLLNRTSPMFTTFYPYEDEIYFADDLAGGMEQVVADVKARCARVPRRIIRELGWSVQKGVMVNAWRDLLK